MRSRDELRLPRKSFSISDLIWGGAALTVLAGLMLPALSQARSQSRLMECQTHLVSMYRSLVHYANEHQGQFVPIPVTGPTAFAGFVAIQLKEDGYLDEDSIWRCPGRAADRSPCSVPSIEQVLMAESASQLQLYQADSSGDYGYSLGTWEDGKYVPPRILGRPHYVLLADRPEADTPAAGSLNHDRRGQNCLFENGKVQFVSGGAIGDDAIFLNDLQMVAPGAHAFDSVVAASHIRPMIFMPPSE